MGEMLPRFTGGGLPATVVIDSGNGLQALWRFDEPMTDIDRFEAINKPFSEVMGSKGTYNVDRLLRIPGTLNLPNKAKLRKGYPAAPSLARVVHSSDARYSIIQLEGWTERAQAAAKERARAEAEAKRWQQEEQELAGLPEALRTKFAAQLRSDPMVERRWRGDTTGLKDTTRSGIDMSLAALLKKRGYTYDDMVAILRIFPRGAGAEKDDRYSAGSGTTPGNRMSRARRRGRSATGVPPRSTCACR